MRLLAAHWLVAAAVLAAAGPAAAQGRQETLLVVTESGPNSMDIHGVGTNRPAYQASWNLYDRLMTYGVKTLPDGSRMYDYTSLKPELAESWTVAPDGMSVTFKLRRDAKFHDGTPVTAQDVKWSFDRAVTVGGFPTFQMKAGSLEKPEQFEAVDDHTFRVKFVRKDKLTLPDLAVPVPVVINSTLARKHATASDPWAMEWLKNNVAGSGAYRLESWKPGQETIYARFDDWKSGPLPKLRRVIVREVPSAGNRRALLERGDADISFDLPPKDFAEMARAGKVAVVSHPVENAFGYVGMNVKNAPFSHLKVRQAVAHAIPYDNVFSTAVFGRGVLLSGNPIASGTAGHELVPAPFKTDPAKAKALMAEAGFPGGFETTLSFDQGFATINEPMAVLVQESLAQIGIKATINKIPGANWRNMLLKKELPIFLNAFGGWLNYPEYFFFWNYHGQNAVFNTSSYQSGDMDRLIEAARFESDPRKYTDLVRGFAKLAVTDLPRVPVYQPWLDVAMQKNVKGYQYWFHRQLDYRQLSKEKRGVARLRLAGRRLALAVPGLLGVVVVTFLLNRALPGDPAAFFAGPAATREAVEQIRTRLGLDRSLPEQFGYYVRDLARGDLGTSLTTGQPVLRDLLTRLPASLELTLAGLVLAVAVALPLGVLAATRPGSWIDHASRVLTTAGVSLPIFFTGLLLVYVFYFLLGWAPAPLGRLDAFSTAPPERTGFLVLDAALAHEGALAWAALRQLALPALTLGLFAMAPIARMTRASMLGVLGSDFIRTARAAGLAPRTVLVTYALRNALLPVITLLGMVFSFLLGANVLVEKVFAWPGIGSYALEALIASDYAPVQGFVLMMATLYVFLNLAIDVVYGLVDPRVRIEA